MSSNSRSRRSSDFCTLTMPCRRSRIADAHTPTALASQAILHSRQSLNHSILANAVTNTNSKTSAQDKSHPLRVVNKILQLPRPQLPPCLKHESEVKDFCVPVSRLLGEASQFFFERGPTYRIGVTGNTESKHHLLQALDFEESVGFTRDFGSRQTEIGSDEDSKYMSPDSTPLTSNCRLQSYSSPLVIDPLAQERPRFEYYSLPSYYDMPVSNYIYKYKAFAMSLLIRLFTSTLTKKDEELALTCHHLGIPLAFVHTEGKSLSQCPLYVETKEADTAKDSHYKTMNARHFESELSTAVRFRSLPPLLLASNLVPWDTEKINLLTSHRYVQFFVLCPQTLLNLTRGSGHQACFDEVAFLRWVYGSLTRKHRLTSTSLQAETLPIAKPSSLYVTKNDILFDDDLTNPRIFRVAFAGSQGSGKSSLLNSLFGAEVAPVRIKGHKTQLSDTICKYVHPERADIVAYELPGTELRAKLNGLEYFKEHRLHCMSVVLMIYESDLEESHFVVARACTDASVPIAFVHSKADQGLQHVLTAIPDSKLAARQMRDEITCVFERLCRVRDMSSPVFFLISSWEYLRVGCATQLARCHFDEELLLLWLFSYYQLSHPEAKSPADMFLGCQYIANECRSIERITLSPPIQDSRKVKARSIWLQQSMRCWHRRFLPASSNNFKAAQKLCGNENVFSESWKPKSDLSTPLKGTLASTTSTMWSTRGRHA